MLRHFPTKQALFAAAMAPRRIAVPAFILELSQVDPATDPHIPAHFHADAPEGKAQCKSALQAELALVRAERDAAQAQLDEALRRPPYLERML